MDNEHFDALSRRLAAALTRRGIMRVGILTGSATALTALTLARELVPPAASKKRKKKKRKKKKRPITPAPPCGGQCGGDAPQCCSPTTQDPQGFCTAEDDVCCTSAEGGGSCSASLPKCCPPTEQFENGLCGDLDDTCCPSDKGGYLCAPGFACCASNDDCPLDTTCDQNCCLPSGDAKALNTRRDYDVRRHG